MMSYSRSIYLDTGLGVLIRLYPLHASDQGECGEAWECGDFPLAKQVRKAYRYAKIGPLSGEQIVYLGFMRVRLLNKPGFITAGERCQLWYGFSLNFEMVHGHIPRSWR
jgi:hypothetical protein